MIMRRILLISEQSRISARLSMIGPLLRLKLLRLMHLRSVNLLFKMLMARLRTMLNLLCVPTIWQAVSICKDPVCKLMRDLCSSASTPVSSPAPAIATSPPSSARATSSCHCSLLVAQTAHAGIWL